MKCMTKREKVSYHMKNKDIETENEVRKMKRLSCGCLGEGEKPFYQERLGRNGTEIARIKFIGNLSFLMDREVSIIKKALFSFQRAIEDLTRGVHSKDSRWIEVAIEHP